MAEGRVLTHKILMILLFCSGTFALRAQEKNYEVTLVLESRCHGQQSRANGY